MKTELIVPISEFRILRDFMPEWNEPTGDSKTTIVDWNTLMDVVAKIAEYRMAYPKETGFVCDCKIVVYKHILYREVLQCVKFLISHTGK